MNPMQQIIDSVDDALVRIKQDLNLTDLKDNDLIMLSWPQTWGSTACGFCGMAGQAITAAQTVIILYEDNAAYIYHNARFAYKLNLDDRRTRDMTDKFTAELAFPGQYDIMNKDTHRFISYDLPQIK